MYIKYKMYILLFPQSFEESGLCRNLQIPTVGGGREGRGAGGHNPQPQEGKQWWHEAYICAQLSWISNAIQACQPPGNYSSSRLLPGAQFQVPAGYVPSPGTCLSAGQAK